MIHNSKIDNQNYQFNPLYNVRGGPDEKLQQLLDARNRRLNERIDSPLLIKFLFDQILESFDNVNLATTV